MSTIDEGYIKYDRSHFTTAAPLASCEYEELERWRLKLYQLKLIGEYLPEKIGYGNMSILANYQEHLSSPKAQFCITATQTGALPTLTGEHYTRVLSFDLEKNIVHAHGPREASSESLTHAAIYDSNKMIKAVIHIHCKKIWEGMIKDDLTATSSTIPYGTMEMAYAVQDITSKLSHGSFVMKGHDDGVVIYSTSLEQAGALTLDLYQRYHKL